MIADHAAVVVVVVVAGLWFPYKPCAEIYYKLFEGKSKKKYGENITYLNYDLNSGSKFMIHRYYADDIL